MKGNVDNRAVELGEYIAESGATVRECAKRFDVSKSTVHKDVTRRLPRINAALYRRVRSVLDLNKEERHIRGGQATKRKYELLSESRSRSKTLHS